MLRVISRSSWLLLSKWIHFVQTLMWNRPQFLETPSGMLVTEFRTVFGLLGRVHQGGRKPVAGPLLVADAEQAPRFILFDIIDSSFLLIVSGWQHWERCLAHLSWTGLLPCCLVSKFDQYSESPWIIFLSNVRKSSESLIRLALDAADPSAYSPTFIENIFRLIVAAGAAELSESAEGTECLLFQF